MQTKPIGQEPQSDQHAPRRSHIGRDEGVLDPRTNCDRNRSPDQKSIGLDSDLAEDRAGSPPDGGLPAGDGSYVTRPSDREFVAAVVRRDSVVLIRGARQVGKTSLLARGIHAALQQGINVVYTDFQKFNLSEFSSADSFYMTLGTGAARALGLKTRPRDVWDPYLGANSNFEEFVKDHLLRDMTRPFLWAMDEVDRLFASDFGGDVFGLFRSWHNGRSIDPLGPWSRLTLAIAYATEAHLFIKDLNQSPFNVGTLVSLSDLTFDELEELNRPARLTASRRGGPSSILRSSRGPSVHCKPGAFRDEKASSRSGVFRADCDTRGWPLWRTFAPSEGRIDERPRAHRSGG